MENAQIKPKTTPKDFFLWLGAMVTLYVSATSLILLVHQYIQIYLPDQAITYGDPYSGTIRFSIASLVVMYPLFVWLMWMLHSDIRKMPEKKEIWVRRWLVVLTLFIAGLTMAGDIISVIYTYLQGDLSIRFALKALTVFVVLGGGFWYYLEELKGTWEKQAGLSKIIGTVVSFLVLIALVSSFFIIGSPETARLTKLDVQKTSDLQTIQYQVVNYWQTKGKLPSAISDLEDPLSGFIAPKDPQTAADYVYKSTSAMSFQLCATFNVVSKDTSGVRGGMTVPAPVGGDLIDENWQHGAGLVCFDRTIDPQRFPPIPTK